jgi:hypothetical protein
VLFLRGVLKGEASIQLSAELSVSPQTILNLRRDVQDSARFLPSKTPLTDDHTETDEMFQYAGGKKRATRGSNGSAASSSEQATWAWNRRTMIVRRW